MEEYNISNSKESIQDSMNNIFIHIVKPEFLPVGTDFISIQNLDSINKESCQQISIGDLLDYIDHNEAMNILDIILDKLDPTNGKINIQAIDFFLFCSAITFSDINIEIGKKILFDGKIIIHNMYDIETEMLNRGLEIIEKKYINLFEYYIQCKKP